MLEDILIPIAFFASAFGILYIFITTRNKERMALIEKGQTASDLFNMPRRKGNWYLKLGIMSVGVSLGIIAGYHIAAAGHMPEDVAYPAMIFLFAGIGLIISHIIESKQKRE